MKFRNSGITKKELLESLLSPDEILKTMEVDKEIDNYLDIGCGYGTFIVPATNIVKQKVIGIDIDPKMIDTCRHKVFQIESLMNVELIEEDICHPDTLKKYKNKINYISIFNLLHCEIPQELLGICYDLLADHGKLGIIQWEYSETPRDHALQIRPLPEDIIEWGLETNLYFSKYIDLPPYHFGLIFCKS